MNSSGFPVACRDALTGTGALLIAAGFLAGVYFPSKVRSDLSERQLKSALLELQQVPHYVHKVERLRSDVEKARVFLAQADERLRPLEISDVVQRTADYSRDTGLRLIRLEPGRPYAEGGCMAWPVEVACEGRSAGWAAFLFALETGPQLTTVQSVDLLTPGESDDQDVAGRVRFTFFAKRSGNAGNAGFHDSQTEAAADETETNSSLGLKPAS